MRIYDWKDIALVDSSTLIESVGTGGLRDWLKLNVGAMIEFLRRNKPEYGNIIDDIDGKQYVHGGIALYGGGKNYSQISMSGLKSSLSDYTRYDINISVLENSEDSTLQNQGKLLPNAAGGNDFRFYMYSSDSENSYFKQLADSESGKKYTGIKSSSAF